LLSGSPFHANTEISRIDTIATCCFRCTFCSNGQTRYYCHTDVTLCVFSWKILHRSFPGLFNIHEIPHPISHSKDLWWLSTVDLACRFSSLVCFDRLRPRICYSIMLVDNLLIRRRIMLAEFQIFLLELASMSMKFPDGGFPCSIFVKHHCGIYTGYIYIVGDFQCAPSEELYLVEAAWMLKNLNNTNGRCWWQNAASYWNWKWAW